MLAGQTTPVYFGSALNNFGVHLLLDGFLDYSPPPGPRCSRTGLVEPAGDAFSGFVFKIQANMDPRHRDRIAFVRVVSGVFERNMAVVHAQSGKRIRLANATKVFGQDRETVEDAYPGDVVGIVGSATFAIGDTLAEDPAIVYDEIPRFAPECFAYLENPAPSNYKRFRTGLDQLLQEGVIQSFELADSARKVPLLGAVGPLQFEIVKYRLESEYGAESRLETTPWTVVRWLLPDYPVEGAVLPQGTRLATDCLGQQVLLFPSEWQVGYFLERNPKVKLSERPLPPESVAELPPPAAVAP